MRTLYRQKGASFTVEILDTPNVRDFIDTHSGVLDSAFRQTEMSDLMRERLQTSDRVFSGMKTFHELHEAFPSLLDEKGRRKPFERFLNDVRAVDETYNRNYLRAEYNFVQASAEAAARWERYEEDGDRYNLQYRTAGDDRVRPEHAALEGVTRPKSDPFWDEFYPPNGWNCRCLAVQVRRGKYAETDPEEAFRRGAAALAKDKNGMFRFNSGKRGQTVPDYNPYTVSACASCPVATGKTGLAKAGVPDSELCAACVNVRKYALRRDPEDPEFMIHPTKKGRIRVNKRHGEDEMEANIKIADYLANKYGYKIDLLACQSEKKDADSYNWTLGIKQEYKTVSKSSINAIQMAVRRGSKQAGDIVIRIDAKMTLGDIRCGVKDAVFWHTNIKSLTLIIGGKDAVYTRKQIIKDRWTIKQADFK